MRRIRRQQVTLKLQRTIDTWRMHDDVGREIEVTVKYLTTKDGRLTNDAEPTRGVTLRYQSSWYDRNDNSGTKLNFHEADDLLSLLRETKERVANDSSREWKNHILLTFYAWDETLDSAEPWLKVEYIQTAKTPDGKHIYRNINSNGTVKGEGIVCSTLPGTIVHEQLQKSDTHSRRLIKDTPANRKSIQLLERKFERVVKNVRKALRLAPESKLFAELMGEVE